MINKTKTISKNHLCDAVYNKISVTRQESAELVESILGEIYEKLKSGEDVRLSRFGAFSIKLRAARVGRNIRTGEAVKIEPRRVLKFKPSKVLLERVNSHLLNSSN